MERSVPQSPHGPWRPVSGGWSGSEVRTDGVPESADAGEAALSVRVERERMDRAVPLTTGFLVAVCVFAWLAGPVLEARFGAEALLVAYGGVAAAAGATAYVLVRRVDGRLAGVESRDADVDRGSGADASDGAASDESETVTVSLDELADLDVEREVQQLKTERAPGDDDGDS